jgi:hypothetical protein
MNIENARYGEHGVDILCDIDGVSKVVPIDPDNREYAEIQRQVAAGELTIQDAD